MDRLDPQNVRCPTCRADQEWSEQCRRCKCDLRLLRDVAEAYESSRRRCLFHLRDGSARAALQAARRCHALHPDAESRRLLALGALLCADWATAAAQARPLLQGQ
jgi:hypothetical protein